MNRAEELFLEAREIPLAERDAFLKTACAGETALRVEVAAMLQKAAEADAFFGDSNASTVDAVPIGFRDEAVISGEKEGSHIGRYKLLQRIGEGGMGVVYMAEQEEPVRRRVALKIIKLGMDTKAVVARFEAERQALAMMDHPNIARVLDAGATESGRPYFVMELVQGVPITEFCDRNKLGIRERLELFLPVCKAIQSAHQKGIIHRDIKPSNVMVTLHNGEPMPKVIDFGVAKATSQRLTEKTLFTHYGTMIGTPAYMSPEQAEMSSLDVDTRSDVYSLGVLLYELLTGSTPFPQERLSSLGLGQIQKVLAEEEPEKPSNRLSTMEVQKRSVIAKNRGLLPSGIGSGIPGDLDWIVLKCLEKDRRRRYDTVNGLAMDVARHLADETVLARPPSAAYRFQKAFRRNRAAFLGLAAVVIGLSIGLGIAIAQAVRASRAENLAQERRQDAEAVARFLTEVFQSPDPLRSGYSFTVAEALGRAAERVEEDFVDLPDRREQLQITLGNTYAAIGLHREAIPLREKVVAYRRRKLGPTHELTLRAMSDLAWSMKGSARGEEALKLRQEVFRVREQKDGPENLSTLAASESLADCLSFVGRQSEAEARMENILATRTRLQGAEHPETLRTRGTQAVLLERGGHPEQALKIHEEVLLARRKTLGAENPETLLAIANLAASYHNHGRTADALRLQNELIALRRKVLGASHPETLMAMHYFAYFQESVNPEEAMRLHREVVELRRQYLGPEHPESILSLHYLALAAIKARRFDEALTAREEVVRLRRKAAGIGHPHTVDAMTRLAWSYVSVGRSEAALALLKECAPNLTEDSWLSLRAVSLLAWFEQDVSCATAARKVLQFAANESQPGKIADAVQSACLRPLQDESLMQSAVQHAQRSLELATKVDHRHRAQLALGMAQLRSNHLSEASEAFREILNSSKVSESTSLTAGFLWSIVRFRQGHTAEARELFHSTSSKMKEKPDFAEFSGENDQARRVVAWIAQKEARPLFSPP